MKVYAKLLLISAIATGLLDIPLLLSFEFSITECLGLSSSIALFGVFAAWSYTSRARLHGTVSEEWRVYFALFPATFSLTLTAIVTAALSLSDTGSIVPSTVKGKVILASGITSFVMSVALPRYLKKLL
jgi:hypothetical protein